ncbi:MAG: APC family permease [Bdellovibrionaceae bacterium]|nr:APC family permease [Pseudobdellovibrionaceae bacterium]
MKSESKAHLNWFISAGIVGADIGTSVFYSTGILFPIVGYLAPLLVLAVCLAMWIFKVTYQEGLAMSPRNGGAYSMILRTLGRRVAVVAGALTFVSYLATAAVSSLSGSYYICSLFGSQVSLTTIVFISFIPILFFGVLNIKGIKEPAKIVTGIASFHFVFLFIIGVWSLIYLIFNFHELNLSKFFTSFYSSEKKLTWPLLAYGFAAAFLGITGFESAAQIIESLKRPQMKTLEKLYKTVILAVSATAPLISFVCLAILTPVEVNDNLNHLLSGLTYKIGGTPLKTLLVINAALTLFAATNTSLVGFIGLATTMSKNGNLPQSFLKRIFHKYPSLEGYPYIILPFVIITMGMSAFIAGEVKVGAQVYGIAFLGVMVSFAFGVLLMRNRGFKKSTPIKYLSKYYITYKDNILSIPSLSTILILGLAFVILLLNSNSQVLFMLTFLLSVTALLMAYYRWTILEKRLISHSDLRLGLGKYASQSMSDLKKDLPKYVLCVGSFKTRRLIMNTLSRIKKMKEGEPFELILFYAEGEDLDSSEIFYELLQRVVSQQIAPIIKYDVILTVKILPGRLLDGLNTIKKTIPFNEVFFGVGHDPMHTHELKEEISKDLEISITSIY